MKGNNNNNNNNTPKYKEFKRSSSKAHMDIDNEFKNFDIRICSQDTQAEYKKAMEILDATIGEVSVDYIFKDNNKATNVAGGSASVFAKNMADRYMQLYQAYIHMQIENNIPAVQSIHGGTLKQLGLTHGEVLKLEKISGSHLFKALEQELDKFNNDPSINYDAIWKTLIDDKLRAEALKSGSNDKFNAIYSAYEKIPAQDRAILKRAMNLAAFRHTNSADVIEKIHALQLHSSQLTNQDEKARLILEVRQRIVDPSATLGRTSLGGLGGNALSMINVVSDGSPNYPISEFRNRMYFAYMSNDFINEVMGLPEWQIRSMNEYLYKKHGWMLDKDTIQLITGRRTDINFIPPLFRYGAQADLNTKGIRTAKDPKVQHEENEKLVKMRHFKSFSEKERIALFGTPMVNAKTLSLDTKAEVMVYSGKTAFDINLDPNNAKTPEAKAFLENVNRFGLPMIAGISGTLDQSMTMAAIVGLAGTEKEQEIIRLSYIAFMVPNKDHTAFEILDSSVSFGMPFKITPLMHESVLPHDKGEFAEKVKSRLPESIIVKDINTSKDTLDKKGALDFDAIITKAVSECAAVQSKKHHLSKDHSIV